MKHGTSLKSLSALAAVVAPAVLIALVPVSASASVQPRVNVPTSPNYAGWLVPVGNKQSSKLSASTTFKVPNVTCTTTDDFVVPGVGIPTSSSIIASGVAVGCQGGVPFFTAETDINGVVTQLPVVVHPGDKIITTLSATGGATTGTFQDVTQDFKQSIKGDGGKGTGSCVGIDGDEEGGGGDPPVPDFGKVVFSSSTINGKPISAATAVRLNMATSGGVVQIKTGALTKSGKGFTGTFANTGS
jgi:hypothetical protein